jgi:DNA repair exonuclease SbcCD nuclease subunit
MNKSEKIEDLSEGVILRGKFMKFLHTAGWRLGMKAVQVGGAGERVRAERVKTAERIVRPAREQAVDFILLAGDTFEDKGVERVLIQQAAELLGGAGLPMYLLPGNHDPLPPGRLREAVTASKRLCRFRKTGSRAKRIDSRSFSAEEVSIANSNGHYVVTKK